MSIPPGPADRSRTRPPPRPLDAAAGVLLVLAVAALLAAAVLGLLGVLLSTDTRSSDLCTRDGVSQGECGLAVQLRRTAVDRTLGEAGAVAVAGVVLLVGGTWRGNTVARRRRADGIDAP